MACYADELPARQYGAPVKQHMSVNGMCRPYLATMHSLGAPASLDPQLHTCMIASFAVQSFHPCCAVLLSLRRCVLKMVRARSWAAACLGAAGVVAPAAVVAWTPWSSGAAATVYVMFAYVTMLPAPWTRAQQDGS